MKKFFILLMCWIGVALVLFSVAALGLDRNSIQRTLVVKTFEDDTISLNPYRDFDYEGIRYHVRFELHKKGEDCARGENLLMSDAYLLRETAQQKERLERIRKCLDNGAKVVVETAMPPYVLLQKLGLPMRDVAPGNYYVNFPDIAGFAVYRSGGVYYVGYGRLFGDKRFSKEYYDLMLQGFVSA